jgi:hypothetical protein
LFSVALTRQSPKHVLEAGHSPLEVTRIPVRRNHGAVGNDVELGRGASILGLEALSNTCTPPADSVRNRGMRRASAANGWRRSKRRKRSSVVILSALVQEALRFDPFARAVERS